jgi:hypothetical protein
MGKDIIDLEVQMKFSIYKNREQIKITCIYPQKMYLIKFQHEINLASWLV